MITPPATGPVIEDVDEVLETTRTVRHRLDFDRPVDSAVIVRCVEIAQQATMGSNQEEWRVIAVTDPARKREIARIYREIYDEMVAAPFRDADEDVLERLDPTRRGDEDEQRRQQRTMSGVKHLADNLERVPVITFFATTAATPPAPIGKLASGFYGSIIPLAWSYQLALRSRGLGSVMATAAVHRADDYARLLELPEDFTLVTMIPAAYTRGTDFRRARRKPVDQVLRFERWGRDG
ncbi:MAG: nitroreductase family protein [Patulibacter sp.]|nr:nitroreductase family protein [Patulibacter sp.]